MRTNNLSVDIGFTRRKNILINIPRPLLPITQESLIHQLPRRKYPLELPAIADLHSKTLSTKIIFLPLSKSLASEYKEFLFDEAIKAYTTCRYDFLNNYVTDPGNIIHLGETHGSSCECLINFELKRKIIKISHLNYFLK